MLPRGLEPRTLRLLAVRSDQLSYKSGSRQIREEPSAFFQLENFLNKKSGEPGHRSQCLSHAKRALYHLS